MDFFFNCQFWGCDATKWAFHVITPVTQAVFFKCESSVLTAMAPFILETVNPSRRIIRLVVNASSMNTGRTIRLTVRRIVLPVFILDAVTVWIDTYFVYADIFYILLQEDRWLYVTRS